ncbi:class I adenylate-forming enzyme family protein, partial [Chloroflexota bacterium]
MMTLKSMLEKTVNQYAGKTAIVLGDRRISYAELDEASNKVANALLKMGVSKGDHVAMMLPNSPEFASIFFGIIKAGGIAIPLDVRYKADELASLFDSCKPKIILAENPFSESLVPALSRFKSIEHIIDVSSVPESQFLNYREIMEKGSPQRVLMEIAPDDIGTINYTSGPTSQPRGAVFSHRDLCASAIGSGNTFQQTEKDTVMSFALPWYHMYGLTIVLLASINKGSTIIIVPGTGISINSLMEAINREKGTILLGVPYIYALAAKLAEQEGINSDLSSLRLFGCGGAPLTIDLIHQFKRYYGLTIIDIWGLTEAVAQVTCQPIDGTGKPGASGKAMPGWEIKIVDDNGNELPANQPGEILVSGPMMLEYYNNSLATAEAIKNGWLYTGDIGRIDKNDYLFITGRKKRMIILKGQNVYPDDIEQILQTHPKIAEVKIVGIPDKLRGEIVRADIRLHKGEKVTEQEIRHFCQG